MNILDELHQLAEAEYKTFNNRILPSKQTTLGVRVPNSRKLAKQIASRGKHYFY